MIIISSEKPFRIEGPVIFEYKMRCWAKPDREVQEKVDRYFRLYMGDEIKHLDEGYGSPELFFAKVVRNVNKQLEKDFCEPGSVISGFSVSWKNTGVHIPHSSSVLSGHVSVSR